MQHIRMAGAAAAVVAMGLSLGLSVSGVALAAGGKAMGVTQSAALTNGGTIKQLVVGTDIAIGDEVTTNDKGQVQIRFDDTTELVIGPNSKLKIEDYLLRGDNSAGKLAINALSGTFRFATGNADKSRYEINTPTGTIGVRGTQFDFIVAPDGTQVLLYEGAVKLCNVDKVCVTLDKACSIGTIDDLDSKIVGLTDAITGEARKAFKAAFNYAQNQSPLLRDFWFENSRSCFNKGFTYEVQRGLEVTTTNSSTPDCYGGEGSYGYIPEDYHCGCDCGGPG